jgi:hypothetical protein
MKTITRKMLKASRYHSLFGFRSRLHSPTTYTRKVSAVVADIAETANSVVEAIASTTQTFWQRIVAFVRRVFGRTEAVAV